MSVFHSESAFYCSKLDKSNPFVQVPCVYIRHDNNFRLCLHKDKRNYWRSLRLQCASIGRRCSGAECKARRFFRFQFPLRPRSKFEMQRIVRLSFQLNILPEERQLHPLQLHSRFRTSWERLFPCIF